MAQKTRSINLRESINAPKNKVFSMLVKSDELVRWFPTTAEADPVVGGHYAFTFEFLDPATKSHKHFGKFVDVKAGERVEYTWNADTNAVISDTKVAFILSENNGKTDIQLEHTGWNDTDEATKRIEDHTKGWTFFLQNLKSVLEQGQDSRSSLMGMKDGVQTAVA